MMHRIAILSLVLTALLLRHGYCDTGSSQDAADWRPTDTLRLFEVMMGIGADVYETKKLLARGGRELNPILGTYPSNGRLHAAGALTVAGVGMLAASLPQDFRQAALAGFAGLEGALARQNRDSPRFPSMLHALEAPALTALLTGTLVHLATEASDFSVFLSVSAEESILTVGMRY